MKKLESYLVIGILGYLFIKLWRIGDILKIVVSSIVPILIGAFISFLLEPMIHKLEIYGIKRKYGCFVVYIFMFIIFGLMGLCIYPTLKDQFGEISRFIPEIMEFFRNMNIDVEGRMMDVYGKVASFFSSLATIGIGLGAAIYISLDFKKVIQLYYSFAPKKYQEKYRIISMEFAKTTFMYFRYMLYDTLIFFVIASFVLIIFRIPYPLAFGLILALTNLIPYIGPYIGLVPLAVFGFLNGQGWLCIGIGFGLQFVENTFISPYLLNNMIYLHPVLGIFAMTFFGALFGFWGVVFSRLLIVLCKILIEQLFFLEKGQKMVYNSCEIDDKDK